MSQDNDISQGFDAGNYAAAYETTDYDQAIGRLSMNRSPAYIEAFTLGFFSSYTLDEMSDHVDTYLQAYNSPAGQRCLELGYLDPIEPTDDDPAPFCRCETCIPGDVTCIGGEND